MARRLPRPDRFTCVLIVLATLGVAAGISATRPPRASAKNASCGWDGRKLVARATIVAGGDGGDFVVRPEVVVAGVDAIDPRDEDSANFLTLDAHERRAWRLHTRIRAAHAGARIERCAVSVGAERPPEENQPSGD